jgi:hypothetical protein
MEIRLRGLKQSRPDGRLVASFKEALAITDYQASEPVLEWKGLDELAAVDVDFHGEYKPKLTGFESYRLPVQPSWYWTTHGGGARLIYEAQGELTAHEIAVLSVMTFGTLFYHCTGVEIKSETRHPAYPRGNDTCGSVCTGTTNLNKARRLLLGNRYGDLDDVEVQEAWEEWCEEEGWEVGRSYEHARCLIDSAHASHGTPVWVGDYGIHCKSCEQHGNCYEGQSKPGWVPASVLVDLGRPNRVNYLRNAVKNFCHWEHTRHIVAKETDQTGELARIGYKALLKLWHLANAAPEMHEPIIERIERVFWPSPIVRTKAGWVHADDFTTAAKQTGLEKILQNLPAVQMWDTPTRGKPKWKASSHKLGIFQGGFDLTDHGYPPLTPIRGVDLAWAARQSAESVAECLGTPDKQLMIPVVVPCNPPFRFRSAKDRDLAWAEKRIQESFPGLDFNYLRYAICTIGLTQLGREPEPPRTFVLGQSGSAKTATLHLAAAMCGQNVGNCIFTANQERLLQSYGEVSATCTIALFDEIAKQRVTDEELQAGVLNMVRGKQYHRLYVGPTPIDSPAAVFFCDTALPSVFTNDTQLARRVVLIQLGAGINASAELVNWKDTCDCGDIRYWRQYSRENADAADMIVSDVMDTYFRNPHVNLQKIAKAFGYSFLTEPIGDVDSDLPKKTLFDAVCADTEHAGTAMFKGQGWKVVALHPETPIAAALRECGVRVGEPAALQALTGCQWRRVLGIPGVELDLQPHGQKIAIRFRLGKSRAKGTKYNADIASVASAGISVASESHQRSTLVGDATYGNLAIVASNLEEKYLKLEESIKSTDNTDGEGVVAIFDAKCAPAAQHATRLGVSA